jgi:hypothetical protein
MRAEPACETSAVPLHRGPAEGNTRSRPVVCTSVRRENFALVRAISCAHMRSNRPCYKYFLAFLIVV